MPFQAVATQRLYQRVAAQISELIRSGELPSGERLPAERDLARRLGVSRPTVREAMVALEIAGLVEVRTGSGVFVRAATPIQPSERAEPAGQFDSGPGPFDLLEARLIFEPEIAAVAARKASQKDIDGLESAIRALQAATDHQSSIEADRQFHTAVAEATGNSVLVGIVQDFWANMTSPIFEALSSRTGLPDTDSMTLIDHREILRHVLAREPELAREAMRAHLNHVEAILATPDFAVNGSLPQIVASSFRAGRDTDD
jgi:DNA-binding FadR family transcriptional regulator